MSTKPTEKAKSIKRSFTYKNIFACPSKPEKASKNSIAISFVGNDNGRLTIKEG